MYFTSWDGSIFLSPHRVSRRGRENDVALVKNTKNMFAMRRFVITAVAQYLTSQLAASGEEGSSRVRYWLEMEVSRS